MTIYFDSVETNNRGFKLNKSQKQRTITYPTTSFSDLNLVHDSGNIYSLTYDAYTIQPTHHNVSSITTNDYTISVISSSSNLTYSSTDKANNKIEFTTNNSLSNGSYNITVRITDSFNFYRHYTITVKYTKYVEFPTTSYTLSIPNNNRKVNVNSVDISGLGLSHSWTVKDSNSGGNIISYTPPGGTGRVITINNGSYARIYVSCTITYTMANGESSSTMVNNTFNNNFGYSLSQITHSSTEFKVLANNKGTNPNDVEWQWWVDDNIIQNWSTYNFATIPTNYRNYAYEVKVEVREISQYGFMKVYPVVEPTNYLTLPIPTFSITDVTFIGNRTYRIAISPQHTVIASSMEDAVKDVSNPLDFQFNEYATGENKNISVTIQNNIGYTATASKNDFYLNITFDSYNPTLYFVWNKTRRLKITDSTSVTSYNWSASPGITLDNSGLNPFANKVVEDSVAGTVYVTVTQTNSLGFEKITTREINTAIPTLTFQLFNFTIINRNSFTDTLSSSLDTGQRRVKNSSGNIVTTYEIEDTYTLQALLRNNYGFESWLDVDTETLNNPVIDIVNTIVRDTSIELHWTSEPAEELSASSFNITYTSSTTTNNVQATYPSHTITGLTAGTLYTVDVQKVYNNQYRRSASNNITTSYIDTTGDYSSGGNIKLTFYLENGTAVYQHVFNHVLFDEDYTISQHIRWASHTLVKDVRPSVESLDNWDYLSYRIKLSDMLRGTSTAPGSPYTGGLTSLGLTLADIHSYTLVSTNHQVQPYMGVTTINSFLDYSGDADNGERVGTQLFPPTNTITSIESIFPMVTGLAKHPTHLSNSNGGYSSSDFLYLYVKQRCISGQTKNQSTAFSQYHTPNLINSGIIWINPDRLLSSSATKPSYYNLGTYLEAHDAGRFEHPYMHDGMHYSHYFEYSKLEGSVEESELWNSTIVESQDMTNGPRIGNSIHIGPTNNIQALYWDNYKELATWNTTDPDDFEVKLIWDEGRKYYTRRTVTISDMNLPNKYV